MEKFQSTKILDGYSTCFRTNHLYAGRILYGGAVSFKLWFEGELDHRNWIVDFGFLKRSKYKIENIEDVYGNKLEPMYAKDYFNWLFDHTLIMDVDDPYLMKMKFLNQQSNIAQLRVLTETNIQGFTKHVYSVINNIIKEEAGDRVKIVKIEGYLQNREKFTYYGD
jgi:hypothetical protein